MARAGRGGEARAHPKSRVDPTMDTLKLLCSDWTGILTTLVIAFMLGMGGYFGWLFIGKSGEGPKS